MTVLIAGLIILLLPHSLSAFAANWRARAVARLGLGPYKLAYSVVSAIGLALIIWGFGMARTDPTALWPTFAGAPHVTAALTVLGFILVVAAYVPRNHFRTALRNPMTAGVALWALGHLVSNGRIGDVVLFGAFLVWALVLFASRWKSGPDPTFGERMRAARHPSAGTASSAPSLARDAIAVVVGMVAALVFAIFLHGPLIGIRPFG